MMKKVVMIALLVGMSASSALAQKTIIVISETSQVDTGDKLLLDALGAGPVTIPGGGTVSGLGYTIVLKDDDNYTEDTFTSADGDLILILESIGSGSANDTHADDLLPVMTTESFLADQRIDRSSFWFTDTATPGGGEEGEAGFAFSLELGPVLTDVTHPITSIFSLGPLAMFTVPTQTNGVEGTLASGVTLLATDTSTVPEATLMVADAGATLDGGPAAPPGPTDHTEQSFRSG